MEWFGLEHGILYGLERARNDLATSRIIFLTFLGQWQLVIAMATILAIPLLRFKNPNGPAAAKGLVLSIVLCIGITELTKRIVSRERPDIVSTAGNYTKPESASFPSGHASCSMAFALAFVQIVDGNRVWCRQNHNHLKRNPLSVSAALKQHHHGAKLD